MKKRSSALEPLAARLRRAQFVIGLGFAAAFLGGVIAAELKDRLQPHLEELSWPVAMGVASYLLSELWVLAVLPALCYGVSLIVDLKPWRTAIGAAATGELFYLAVIMTSGGLEGMDVQWVGLLLLTVPLGAGIVLSRQAILRGRAAVERAQARAKQAAEANQAQYDEFAREAERLAARHDVKPAGPAAPEETAAPQPSPAPDPAEPEVARADGTTGSSQRP